MMVSFLQCRRRKETVMPWNGVMTMSELRIAFVHRVLDQAAPVAEACRQFGISRKTGYKWLHRFRQTPQTPLEDHSRRPNASPHRTPRPVVDRILQLRDRYHWGAAKIHVYLRHQGVPVPSARTVHNILRRQGRTEPTAPPKAPCQRFERSQPNDLWQLDFKAHLELQRQRIYPLTILDDHSRYLLRLTPCADMRFATAWQVLWDLFGDVGMPRQLLSDNQFNSNGRAGHAGLSWFDAQLLRLGIRSLHGRPFHPQTQGKVERIHGTINREILPFADRTSLHTFAQDLDRWRSRVYNACRPHEALAMDAPVNHWTPSQRPRPDRVPDLEYAPGSLLRKIQAAGWISYRSCRILIGKGLAGDFVRLEDHANELTIYYANYPIRRLANAQLNRHTVL
jgi:transposase InsO family protein